MISPIFSASTTLSNSANRFVGLGWGRTSVVTSDANAAYPMSSSGTHSNLYVNLSAAPGAGTSYAVTLVKNGSDTAVTCTVADTNTAASDSSNSVNYVAGDTFSLKFVPTGTPATSVPMTSIENSASGQTVGSGDGAVVSNSVPTYFGLQSGTQAAATTDMAAQIPTAGTITNLYLQASASPGGAGKGYTATLVKNGSDTTLTCTTNNTTTANDTTHSVSVVAGDTAYWRIDPISTPTATRIKLGILFTPTIDGESIQTSAITANLTNSGNNFIGHSGGPLTYSTTESARADWLGTAFDLKKLYASVDTANAAASWAITVRTASGNSAVTCTITGVGVTTANDTTHTTSATVPNYVDINIVGTLSPTATPGQFSYVTYRAPVAASTTDFFQMF